MQKPLALSIAACLGLSGCSVFEKSETWNEAVRVRPGETTRDPDPSNAYAAKLHSAFTARGTEHKVVVYQYRYTTRLREEAIGTRTAVIYRDNATPSNPWWLKDDRLNTPVWLPNGDLNKQVSFYIRRKAEVLETQDYPSGGSSGKTAVAFAKPAPALRPFHRAQSEKVETKVAAVKKAPVVAVALKPAPAPAPAPARVAVQKPVNVKPREKVKAPATVKAEAPKKAPVVVKTLTAPETTRARQIAKAPEVKKVAPKPIEEPAARPKIKPIVSNTPPESLIPTEEAPATKPEAEVAPAAESTNRNAWAPPATIDATQQSHLTAPRDSHLEKLFRTRHGTEYNRFSPADRRKMQQLEKGVASRD